MVNQIILRDILSIRIVCLNEISKQPKIVFIPILCWFFFYVSIQRSLCRDNQFGWIDHWPDLNLLWHSSAHNGDENHLHVFIMCFWCIICLIMNLIIFIGLFWRDQRHVGVYTSGFFRFVQFVIFQMAIKTNKIVYCFLTQTSESPIFFPIHYFCSQSIRFINPYEMLFCIGFQRHRSTISHFRK